MCMMLGQTRRAHLHTDRHIPAAGEQTEQRKGKEVEGVNQKSHLLHLQYCTKLKFIYNHSLFKSHVCLVYGGERFDENLGLARTG